MYQHWSYELETDIKVNKYLSNRSRNSAKIISFMVSLSELLGEVEQLL